VVTPGGDEAEQGLSVVADQRHAAAAPDSRPPMLSSSCLVAGRLVGPSGHVSGVDPGDVGAGPRHRHPYRCPERRVPAGHPRGTACGGRHRRRGHQQRGAQSRGRPELLKRYEQAGGGFLVCPICFNARQLDEGRLLANAEIGGTVPFWQCWGDPASGGARPSVSRRDCRSFRRGVRRGSLRRCCR
jgi:hypothetical protein